MNYQGSGDKRLADIELFYRRIRDQYEHENELYNQRIIWLITIQALLYATVGLVLQSLIESGMAVELNFVHLFILLIAVLGILVALVASRTLTNGRKAQEELRDFWNDVLPSMPGHKDYGHLFPAVAGGTVKSPRHGSIFRSGNLPLYFILSWIASAIILVGAAFV